MKTERAINAAAAAISCVAIAGCAAVNGGLGDSSAGSRTDDSAGELRAFFKCSDEEPFWTMEYSSTERVRQEPGDPEIITTVTPGSWTTVDDDAGVYIWRSAETGRNTTIRRRTCINVASEELSYAMDHSGNRTACCRRFTE